VVFTQINGEGKKAVITAADLTTISLWIAGGLYGLALGAALLRRNLREIGSRALLLYTTGAVFWATALIVARFSEVRAWWADAPAYLPLYGVLVLAVLFLYLTRSFLRLGGSYRNWWLLGAAWVIILALLDSNLVTTLPDVLLQGYGWLIRRQGFFVFALILGWGIFMSRSVWLTVKAYGRAHQPLHRNRLKYWLPALGSLVLGDALLFIGEGGILSAAGHGFHLLGTLVAAAVVLVHRLPDVRLLVRRALNFAIATFLVVAAYIAAFLAAEFVFRGQRFTWPPDLLGYNLLITGAALAMILTLVVNPLLNPVRKLVNRLISGVGYDPRRTLGEYSLSISNILELERLAETSVRLINEALDIQHGVLFRVDQQKGPDEQEYYYLRGLKGINGGQPPSGLLSASNPVAEYLRQAYGPLTQYDIDLLPRFRTIPTVEWAWLSHLGMDVYVPIYAKGKWIGLLALGPKVSRDRYYDEDLALLNTLADQTAVALENARLVEDLVKLNQELRKTNRTLDDTRQQLEHLDRAKSDFINIVSHELRTPLTLLLGYSEILLDEPAVKGNTYQRQMAGGIFTGATRLREIVDSMFDVAKIDSRTLQLNPNPVPIWPIVEAVSLRLRKPIEERQLTFEINLLEGLPPVEADSGALDKVFYHLLINAIKYTPDGGRITVSGRKTDAILESIEVVVSDTGIGIDSRFHELIFTKFYQTGEVALHSTGKTKFKGGGPGLGLAIARGIVEAHGGRVWVESSGYDEKTCPGSHFHVLLPVRQTSAG